MLRLILVSLIFFSCVGQLRSDDPSRPTIVVSNLVLMELLKSRDARCTFHVLDGPPHESYDAMNARAISLRDSHYILYDSSNETMAATMFRERLTNHGVVAIDLRNMVGMPTGRRFQSLAGSPEKSLRLLLNSCLLTDDEMLQGPAAWQHFEDPIPSWLEWSMTK